LGESTPDFGGGTEVSEIVGTGAGVAEAPASRAPSRLTSAQMARMSRLLDEALELDEGAQREWLAALGSHHQDIAEALREALSIGRTGTEEALVTLPKLGSDGDVDSHSASDLKPGARVGPYELIRPLGSGGMAEVWLARRADGAFKREVALKLPMLTRLRKDLEERFARERDILASLEHTNIARLYDAGTDSNGLPYLSMEYVAGQPVTDSCDAHKLSISDRLQLVLQVLDGVQYAHEHHVIHRDLKPSNILVTESGQVRLLDFGIAKLLVEDTDQAQLTSVYGRALTPDYASPELLKGDAIDARSDVYSLGVVLYELLTGSRPYRLKAGASVGILEQAITTVEVGKPSTRIEPQACDARAATQAKLARRLRGDLDVIVLKALAKEPSERYESAASMAEDLRRHLHSEAIRARPPTLSYRIRKFARRRRMGVIVAAAAIAVIVSMAAYEIQRIATDQERRIAALPTANPLGEKSIAVMPFIDLSEKKDQEYFSDGLSEELIDLLSRVKELQVIARTSSFYFKGKAVTVAQISKALGTANILEGSVRKAGNTLRVTAQLIRADGGVLWSQTFNREVTDLFKLQDEIGAAVAEALKSKLVPALQPKDAERSDNPDAYNWYLLGKQYGRRNNLENSRRALAAYREAIDLDPHYGAAYAGVSLTETRVADYTLDAAQLDLARAAAQKAIALAPQYPGSFRARAYGRLEILDFAGALADERQALNIAPSNTSVQNDYGVMLAAFGRLAEAIQATRKAIELDPLDDVAWGNLGEYLTASGQFQTARQALARAAAINPDDDLHPYQLGVLDLLEGRHPEALAEFRWSSDPVFQKMGEALVEHSLGDDRQSQQLIDKLTAKYASDSAYQIADVWSWCGDKDKALLWLERAYRQRDSGLHAVMYDPLLTTLRDEPRFRSVLKRLDLL
jgi:serine/threonine protein kinase/Tfp pilus assembly protein PilF